MSDCLNNEEQIKSNLSENNSDNLTSNLDGNVEISSTIDKTNNVTSQMNTLNETSSNLGSEEPLKSKLDFPITGMYSGSQGDNINVEVDNQGFIIRASLKQIKFNSVADFPTIGSERLIYIDATGKSLYGWDSATASYYKLSAGGSGSGDSPTKTSQLENDGDGTSPFSTKNYVDGQVSTIPKFKVEVITELPTENISTSTIYLMRNVKGEYPNIFTEYIYTGSGWEILGEQLPFDLTNYPTIDDWSKLVTNKRVIRNTEGGFKGGASNTTPDEDVGSGGAIGNLAKAETGFAGGYQAVSWSGGAVGSGSFAGKGFAGGYNAKAYGNNGELSDSIQLGTGYNSNEKTMQVYDDNIYDANTHTLTVKNIELDGEDIKDLMGGTPDAELNDTSTNAVQNKVVANALKTKYINLTLNYNLSQNWSTLSVVKFNIADNHATEYFSYSNSTGNITVLKDCNIKVSAGVNLRFDLGTATRFIVTNNNAAGDASIHRLCSAQSSRPSDLTSNKYEILNATSYIASVQSGTTINLRVQNSHNNTTQVGMDYSFLCVEVVN